MFTGIIEAIGKVESVSKSLGIGYIQVKSKIFSGQKTGDSVAINGVCLTISDLKKDAARFDVMPETLDKSNLANLKIGDKVNLERALRIGDRLSGHFVTGHIDCAGKIVGRNEKPGTISLKVKISIDHMKFVVPKGSVALNGVSLTIAGIGPDDFTVCLIPHTTKNTNLDFSQVGDELNVEFDLIVKSVQQLRETGAKGPIITEKFLKDKGFC